jgi:hypothetical protein
MPSSNRAEQFERAMKPQMQAIRGVREALQAKQNDFSKLYGVDSLAEEVDKLAVAFEELVDATAEALDSRY